MELKCLFRGDISQRAFCFNRTFMELKFCQFSFVHIKYTSFNRTFMELKYMALRFSEDNCSF